MRYYLNQEVEGIISGSISVEPITCGGSPLADATDVANGRIAYRGVTGAQAALIIIP
jgi:hypothetical protein